ncbi:hypothetical protein A1O3_10048, partial [Capronia epimyces CBS 606.96]
GSRSRVSSTCPTPLILQSRDYDDDCRTLRRTLGAIHKLSKGKPRQIEAISQSLGKASGRDGPDEGLAIYIQNFDNSVRALYRVLSLNVHVLHSSTPPLDVREFSDDLGSLAVDLERWQKEFSGLVFPSLAPGDGRKSPRDLKAEARALAKRCFVAAGKLDALVCLDDVHATNGLLRRLTRHRSPSSATQRTHTRTPSPVPSATASSAAVGGVSSSVRSSSPSHVHSPQPSRSGRGAGLVGVA